MTTGLFGTLLSAMLIFWAATVALARGPAPDKCLPVGSESESWVANAKPMATGTWSGIWCGSTREGVDPESVYPAAQENLMWFPEEGPHNLLLLTDDGQLLRLLVSGCAGDLSVAQSSEAQALEDATRQHRVTLTVAKSKTDPKSNELIEAKDSTGKVVYRLGLCH
jgi:hypothetical protein